MKVSSSQYRMKYKICLVVQLFMYSSFSLGEESLDTTPKIPRKVKGQHYESDTMVARVVGAAGLSEDLLRIVQNEDHNAMLSPNATLVVGADGTGVPTLVTENMKTSITKISIPLSITFLDSEWYRNTLKKFLLKNKIAILNRTEQQFSENEIDVYQITENCFSAAQFRNNIVNVFGQLLYHPRQVLSEDLYHSLQLVMKALKLRRVSFMDDLDIVERMKGESIHNQFITLFETLEKAVPKYVRSSVTYWLECLYHKMVDINEILKDANFLTSFNEQQLKFMSKKMLFSESIIRKSLRSTEEILGKKLSYIITEILEQRIPLNPQLFSGVMAHLPANTIIPEVEESLRYTIELIKQSDANTFTSAISNIKIDEFPNPFNLIRSVLISLSQVNFLGKKEILEIVALGVDRAISPYASSDYQIMLSLTTSNQIKNLLTSINPKEYSVEAITYRDKILHFIYEDKNNYDLIQYNKYFYQDPKNLLLALLVRLSTVQNVEIAGAAAALKSIILLKKAEYNIKLALTVKDINTLLSVGLSPDTQVVAEDLKRVLQDEKLSVQKDLLGYSMQDCNTAPDCIHKILDMLVSKNVIKNEVVLKKMEEVLRKMNSPGFIPQRRFLRNVDTNCILCKKFQADEVIISSETNENLDVFEESFYK